MAENISAIQIKELGGQWFPEGSGYICDRCGVPGTTKVGMLMFPNHRLICHDCADELEM